MNFAQQTGVIYSGWVHRPHDVERVLRTLPTPVAEGAAVAAIAAEPLRDFVAWDAEQKVLGRTLPAYLQTEGTCVSKGFGRLAQDAMLEDIAEGEPEEVPPEIVGQDELVASEPIYAGSRVEVGGGQLGANEGGSTGAWAAKWISEWGILLRRKYGSIDLSRPDDNRAVAWGAPRAGCPDELEPVAKLHPIRTVSLVPDADTGCKLLSQGYGIGVCSGQGFTTTRDAQGFCRPSGTWYHCMAARGFVLVKGNEPAVPIQQSWGQTNPGGPNRVTLESGRELILPAGVFLIRIDVFDRMLKSWRDSFAGSQFVGFPKNPYAPF